MLQMSRNISHTNFYPSRRLFSTSFRVQQSDPLPSILADVSTPLDVTSVLRNGQGFKIRTLADPAPRILHGNLVVVHGEYFLWRPTLSSPQSGTLDIAPESWGIFDVITPKPGIIPVPLHFLRFHCGFCFTGSD